MVPETVHLGEVRLPRVPGGWRTILADPPWRFDDVGSRLRTPYPTLTVNEIACLPVRQVVAPQAHLYLWVTDVHLLRMMSVAAIAEAWGFTPVQTLVWRKVDRRGRTRIGGGHYYRHAHELLVFGTRGGAKLGDAATPSVFDAQRGRHSEKPEQKYHMIERHSPGPRLELFARRPRQGWTCWGNEVQTSGRRRP